MGKVLKIVGFFRETHPFLIRGDLQNLPSFHDYVADSPQEQEECIVKYLQNGKEHLYIGSRPIYRKLEDRRLVRTGANLTDGEWTWPTELAYYVEQFHLQIPSEFFQHMAVNGWVPPRDIQFEDLVFPGMV